MPSVTSTKLAQLELVIIYLKESFPGSPKELTLSQLKDFEYINISDSNTFVMNTNDIRQHQPRSINKSTNVFY